MSRETQAMQDDELTGPAALWLLDGEALPEPMGDHRPTGGSGGSGWLVALFVAWMVASLVRSLFRGLPSGLRGLVGAGAAGEVALQAGTVLGHPDGEIVV